MKRGANTFHIGKHVRMHTRVGASLGVHVCMHLRVGHANAQAHACVCVNVHTTAHAHNATLGMQVRIHKTQFAKSSGNNSEGCLLDQSY